MLYHPWRQIWVWPKDGSSSRICEILFNLQISASSYMLVQIENFVSLTCLGRMDSSILIIKKSPFFILGVSGWIFFNSLS